MSRTFKFFTNAGFAAALLIALVSNGVTATASPAPGTPSAPPQMEDGLLKVCYDQYETFSGEFGHLFYATEYSHYRLRLEYRFTGEQLSGAPGW